MGSNASKSSVNRKLEQQREKSVYRSRSMSNRNGTSNASRLERFSDDSASIGYNLDASVHDDESVRMTSMKVAASVSTKVIPTVDDDTASSAAVKPPRTKRRRPVAPWTDAFDTSASDVLKRALTGTVRAQADVVDTPFLVEMALAHLRIRSSDARIRQILGGSLLSFLRPVAVPADSIIYSPGDVGTNMYFVESGTMTVR